MKWIAFRLFIATLMGAATVSGMWLLKSLIQQGSPDFCAGLVGGVLWMFFMGKAWQMFKWSLEDVNEELEEFKKKVGIEE